LLADAIYSTLFITFRKDYDFMRILIIPLCCIAMAGCMVGPNFHRPTAPHTPRYTQSPLPSKTTSAPIKNSGKAQYFVAGRDVPAEWWKVFHSKPLNDLICAGLANSPNLHAAKAALRQAQETWRAQFGTLLLPAIDGQINGAQRRQTNSIGGTTNSALGSNVFTLYNASVNASYVLDFWGGARRQLESYAAQINYQQFQLEAATLTLTSNIVTTSINMASLKAQISATQEILRSQETQLAIVNKQLKLGAASGVDVLTQETQVAQTRAQLPPLQQNLAKSGDALAVLIGQFPSESRVPTVSLHQLCLPSHLPLSLPSSLVCQRPDIRAQEALLHAASAQIGVATANLFPQVTLTGNYGWNSTNLAQLFSPTNVIWNYGAGILQPIFHGGALFSQRRATIAAYQQAAALYRETVLQAFQNVADTLEALKNDANALQAQNRAESLARKTLSITEKQFKLGGVSYLSLLNAQRQYQQAKINRIQAQAARLADTAALYQALGGGWWNRDATAQKPRISISYRRFTR
jgi:NodT family efflux transporter outer membrane factor (OMF) lipoprotein